LRANTPAISSAGRYARIVQEHALIRRLIAVAHEIAEIGYEFPVDVAGALDQAEAMVFDVAQRRNSDSVRSLKDLLSESLERLDHLYGRGETITGVPTDYGELDHLLSGLQPSNLVVVGARALDGKDRFRARAGDICRIRSWSSGPVLLARDEPPGDRPARLGGRDAPRCSVARTGSGGHLQSCGQLVVLSKGGVVEVRIKKLDINMFVKQNGIEFEVRTPDGTSQVGDCYLTMTGIVWCKGRTTKPNGIKISWDELAVIVGSNEAKRAALKAARTI
jgi:hypothetical protein